MASFWSPSERGIDRVRRLAVVLAEEMRVDAQRDVRARVPESFLAEISAARGSVHRQQGRSSILRTVSVEVIAQSPRSFGSRSNGAPGIGEGGAERNPRPCGGSTCRACGGSAGAER
jgi:hypothetical protein